MSSTTTPPTDGVKNDVTGPGVEITTSPTVATPETETLAGSVVTTPETHDASKLEKVEEDFHAWFKAAERDASEVVAWFKSEFSKI